MVSEQVNLSVRNEKHTQCIRRIYDNDALQNSVFEPYYADAHKTIWKEKYKDFLKLNDATKTKRITQINTYMHNLLTLMCSRFELANAHELDNFFKSNAEHRGNFLKHAHHVIMRLGMQKIIEEQPEKQKQYAGVLVNETYKNNKFLEDQPFVFNLGGKKWSEKQVYAIASIYAIELAILSFEEQGVTSLANLQSDLYRFLSGPEYGDILGIKGANKKYAKNRERKKRAEEIYKEHKLYKLRNNTASYDLRKILAEENIPISRETLETDWIPSFKNKIKILK